MATIGNVQLGKNGITDNFILTLNNQFKTHENVRVHVLKSAREEGKKGKESIKKYSEELLEKLGKKYTSKILGFKMPNEVFFQSITKKAA